MIKLIKVIFIDIDRTLLGRRSKIPSLFNIAALKAAQKKEIHIVLTTGRSEVDCIKIHQAIRANDYCNYIIHSNGSVLGDFKNDKTFFDITLQHKDVNQIISMAKENNFSLKFTNIKAIFSKGFRFLSWIPKRYFHHHRLVDIPELDSYNLRKITIFNSYLKIGNKKLIRKLKEKFPHLEITTSGNGMIIEINPTGVTKGTAMRKLLNHLEIKTSHVAYIGDSDNDIAGLEVAALPIAMKNAKKHIRNKAKFVTDSYNKDGVGKAVRAIINKEL